MPLHNELWFPSVVWSGMIHTPDNTELKNFAYTKKKQDSGVQISNYKGWQSSSIKQGESIYVDQLTETLNEEINLCADQVGLPPLEIYNIWFNINPEGAYNHLHDHAGAVLTGVYYVDAEDRQGNLQIERSDNAQYFIPEKIKKLTYFTATRSTYKAKTGALYIFPAWMKHSVEGNKINKDRISVSFNYGVKNNAN
jgi:uncharacterized protein (TIGR02466 family)